MFSRRWSFLLLIGVAVHAVWGLLRVPTKALGRRLDDIDRYQRDDAAFVLGDAGCRGDAALHWVRQHTEPTAVVIWRGMGGGAMEVAAALLWPRLLVVGDHAEQVAERLGRSVAVATREGRRGRVVLVATQRDLEVEVE